MESERVKRERKKEIITQREKKNVGIEKEEIYDRMFVGGGEVIGKEKQM